MPHQDKMLDFMLKSCMGTCGLAPGGESIKNISKQIKVNFQDAMMSMRDVKSGQDLDTALKKDISWLTLVGKVVESVGSFHLPTRWKKQIIIFSCESDSTTTNVRWPVSPSVCLSITKTPKQLKINHSTLPLPSTTIIF